VARIGGGRRVVTERSVIEAADAHLTAIVHVEQQPVITATQIDGLQYEDVHRVLDAAIGVARREIDVGDHGILGQCRIDGTVRATVQLLVSADSTELAPAERRRLHARNLDASNLGCRVIQPAGRRDEQCAKRRCRTPRCHVAPFEGRIALVSMHRRIGPTPTGADLSLAMLSRSQAARTR
jgi:hypothetical protein